MITKRKNLSNGLLIFYFVIAIICSGSAISICFNNIIIPLLILGNFVFLSWNLIVNDFKVYINRNKIKQEQLTIVLFMIASFIINFNLSGISLWIRLFLTLNLVFFIVNSYSAEELISYYIKTMKLLAIVSLFFYVIFIVLKIPANIMPILVKTTDSTIQYYGIGIFNIWISEFSRNCGPFWEPSIFAAYLSIALIFTLFFNNRDNKKFDILIFTLTIITTKSTGGYILILLVGIMNLLKKKKHSIIWVILALMLSVFIPLIIEPLVKVLLDINYNIFSKIFYFDSMGTTMTRYYSILINLKIWFEHNLLFGVGFLNLEKLYIIYREIVAPNTLAPAQTSTNTLMFAALGCGGIYYLFLWIKAIFIQKIAFISKIIFLIIMVFILNQTPHTYFLLTYYVLYILLKYGYKRRCNN